MRKSRTRLLGIAGVAALAAAGLAIPGVAAAGEDACPADRFCLWADPNYEGNLYIFTADTYWTLPGDANDSADSYRNNTGVNIQVWEHPSFDVNSAYGTIRPGSKGGNLAGEQLYNPRHDVSIPANDVISSLRSW